jgi:hypothetical protein
MSGHAGGRSEQPYCLSRRRHLEIAASIPVAPAPQADKSTGVSHDYGAALVELIRTPFEHEPLIWGIVPLYFGLLLNEMTSSRATYTTAINTGFSFLWAGAHWMYHSPAAWAGSSTRLNTGTLFTVNLLVTILVLAAGTVALWSGLRRKYPPGCSFLGHSRFSNYFMIVLFPIQSNYLKWSWERLVALLLFAVPIWLLLHFGLMPIRNRK